jgi:hypothetical protein
MNQNASFSFLTQPKGIVDRGPFSDLMQIITQSGTKTRDAGLLIKDEPDQWGVIHLDVTIIE